LLALLATRTVNLSKLACVVFGDAQQSSRYRRIQRFFSKFPLDYQQIAGFIFKLFFVSGGQWYLSMDRTNWRWGKSDINILMLGIVFKGTAIPIYWMLLDKRGNSDTPERITLIQMFIDHFGKSRPAVSLFRYGLDFLCDSIVRLAYKINNFQQALNILNSMPSPACS